MNFEDGTLCHINFGKTFGTEINNEHLAVLFNIKGVDNLVLAIPLTSPKTKHFKTQSDFENRNYREVKYFRLHYIVQTDSIALLEQMKSISVLRINNYYKDADGKIVILNEKELTLLKNKIKKYINFILYK